MADLDVSEGLEDPLFTSEVTLIAVEEPVDEYGNAEWTDYARATVQAVVTSDLKKLERLPDELRTDGMILVRVLADEVPDNWRGTGYDTVEWRGRRYVVKDTADYSQFGRGYYRLVCWPVEVEAPVMAFDMQTMRSKGWDEGNWRVSK